MADLRSPLAKLGRAKKHLDTLRDGIDGFLESRPYAAIIEPDPEHPNYVVRVQTQQTPPESWGLDVGDFLNNARSTLDHLIYELSGLPATAIRERKRLQFPIFDYRERRGKRPGYVDTKDRYLNGLSPKDQALIERVQPYHRGQDFSSDPLSLLASLNNPDKHQIVSVVDTKATAFTKLAPRSNVRFGSLRVHGGSITIGDKELTPHGLAIEQVSGGVIAEDGAIVARIRQPYDEPKVDLYPELEIVMEFARCGDRVERHPVLGTLTLIYDRVKDIIAQFGPITAPRS